MSGHNKWSKVKHIKGPADAKRGRLFSKLAKAISVAARDGGADPSMNAALRQAINNAKAVSMPGDTIDRAVKKGTGEIEGASFEEACYEGYGPGGIAMLVEVVTDNKNRSIADIRNIFNKNHGSIADSGSVAYLFERKGEICVGLDAGDEDRILELALEAGAEDVSSDDEGHTIITGHDQLSSVGDALKALGVEPASEQLVFMPTTNTPVADVSTATQVLRLYETLDDYEDTQNVFANFDIPEELLAQVSF